MGEEEIIDSDISEVQQTVEPEIQAPEGPQQVEVMNSPSVYIDTPIGMEGIDYHTYTGQGISIIVRHEVTYGDILISTLLAFLTIFLIIQFFHRLILDGVKKR